MFQSIQSTLKKYLNNQDAIKKILLVRIDRLGDLILTLPAIKAVRQEFPKAHITLLINEKSRNLVENISFVNEIICYEPAQISQLIKELRQRSFDLAIDFLYGRELTSAKIVWKSNARYRVGYAPGLRRFYFNMTVPAPAEMEYEMDLALRVLRHLGIRERARSIPLSLTPQDAIKVNQFLHKHKLKNFVCIHPGVAPEASFKFWGVDKFAQLADNIINAGYQVVFSGDKHEVDLIITIQQKMKCSSISSVGMFTLRELCVLIKRSGLFISCNTGPMHLAVAMKKKSVIISAPTSYRRWINQDYQTTVPNYYPEVAFTERHEAIAQAIQSVTVEDVWTVVSQKLH